MLLVCEQANTSQASAPTVLLAAVGNAAVFENEERRLCMRTWLWCCPRAGVCTHRETGTLIGQGLPSLRCDAKSSRAQQQNWAPPELHATRAAPPPAAIA